MAFSKAGQSLADQMRLGNGGQNILFYDVSNPARPEFKGKLNSCWDGSNNKSWVGKEGIDYVTAAKAGDYYYLSFNGINHEF